MHPSTSQSGSSTPSLPLTPTAPIPDPVDDGPPYKTGNPGKVGSPGQSLPPSQSAPPASGINLNNAPDSPAGLENQNPPDFNVSLNPTSTTMLVGAGGSASSTLTVSPLNGFTGDVLLSTSGSGGLGIGVTPPDINLGSSQTGTLNIYVPTSTPAGNYTVTVTGTCGSLSHSATFTVSVTDFSLSVSPSSLTVSAGSSGSNTVSVNGLNGFTSSVSLSASGLPAGASVSFSPTSVSGTGTSTATISAATNTPLGTFSVTIKGTCGSLIRTTTLSLTVVGFSLSISPATVSVPPGGTGSVTVTVTGISSFAGTVSLSASGQPSGVSPTFTPASVKATGTSTLTFAASTSAVPGVYPITVSGSYGTATLTTTLTLNVTDFSLSAAPASLAMTTGSSKTSTISLTPLYGFTGSATLTVTGMPSGMTAGFAPASVNSGSPSTLTISTMSTVALATYTLTVSGTANGVIHYTTVTVNITIPQVTVSIADLQDVYAGYTITSAATASVNPLPGGYSASQLVATWSYSTVYIAYSATGNDETWNAPSDGSTGGVTLNGAATDPTGTFTGTFNTVGYYEVCIAATVSYHNPATNENFGSYTGYGFVTDSGGQSSNAASAGQIPHGVISHQIPSGPSPNSASGQSATPKLTVKAKPIDHIEYSFDGSVYQRSAGITHAVKGQSIWFRAFKDATTPYPSASVLWRQGHTSADGIVKAVALNSGNPINPIQVTFATVSTSPTDNSQDVTAVVGSVYLTVPVVVDQYAAKISLDGINDAHKVVPGGIVVENADNNNAPRLKVTVNIVNPPANWNGTVTLTATSNSIKVFSAPAGGNFLTFDGIHNVFSKTSLPVTLYVQGQSSSVTMGDVQLKAQADSSGGADTANLTVLWCDQPTIKLTTADHVSPDNSARQAYIDFFTGRDQLGGPFVFATGVGTSCAAEGKAVVHPSNFDNSSFDLKLDQDTQNRLYINTTPDTTSHVGGYLSFSPTLNGVKGNDTAPDSLRDDDQMKIGAIYQIDDPSLNRIWEEPFGVIYRLRFLAKNFANITINGNIVRCSPIAEYNINLSNVQTQAPSGATWVTVSATDPNAVSGDNRASVVPAGQQPPQTWNLK